MSQAAKLNQIIAVEKGIKNRANETVTQLYHAVQKPALFSGLRKTYKPVNDEGERFPEQRQNVQFVYSDVLKGLKESKSELMKITARKDWTNSEATADVSIDGTVILSDVPVVYLLFLEKQLQDIRTVIANMPLRDPTEDWVQGSDGISRSKEPVETIKTKKEERPIVLYEATEKHAAQTQLITKDVTIGSWEEIKFSGAISKTERDELLARAETFYQAVKQARQEANMADEIPSPDVGRAVFDYIYGTAKRVKEG